MLSECNKIPVLRLNIRYSLSILYFGISVFSWVIKGYVPSVNPTKHHYLVYEICICLIYIQYGIFLVCWATLIACLRRRITQHYKHQYWGYLFQPWLIQNFWYLLQMSWGFVQHYLIPGIFSLITNMHRCYHITCLLWRESYELDRNIFVLCTEGILVFHFGKTCSYWSLCVCQETNHNWIPHSMIVIHIWNIIMTMTRWTVLPPSNPCPDNT